MSKPSFTCVIERQQVKYHVPDAPYVLIACKEDVREQMEAGKGPVWTESSAKKEQRTVMDYFIRHAFVAHDGDPNHYCQQYPLDCIAILHQYVDWNRTKYDKEAQPITHKEGMHMTRTLGAHAHCIVSSLTQQGLKTAFDIAIAAVLDRSNVSVRPREKGKPSKKCLIL